jgi:hypothetical protein
MTVMRIFVVAAVLFVIYSAVNAGKPVPKSKPKPKPVKFNTDLLPNLQDILNSLNLSSHLNDFVKMGVAETRTLLRLNDMDFHLMSIEWNLEEDKIRALKDAIAEFRIRATVVEEIELPEFNIRRKLTYGRLYFDGAVQTHEYVAASFGGPPPMGKQKFLLEKSIFGCENNSSVVDYTGYVVAVMRGNCSFLEKALTAQRRRAAGIIIVNSEDKLENPSSGLGVDRAVKEETVLGLAEFPVIAVANTSWVRKIFDTQLAPPDTIKNFDDIVYMVLF